MNDSPLVSVIMPVYNSEKHIPEAINAILNQSYQNWELILIDDGSIDNSLVIAETYIRDNIQIYTQQNQGAASARNRGYLKSKGDFIKFLDSDDLINPEMLEAQMKIGLENPHCIISGMWGRFIDDDISTFQLNPEDCWQDMDSLSWICSSWKNAQPMTQPGIFLIPKAIIEKAGLWNEKLTLIDDYEYFTRTILTAENILFCEKSVLYYRSGNSNTLSGKKSLKSVESAVLSAELAVTSLLKRRNDPVTRRLSANCMMALVYEFGITYPNLLKPVEDRIEELGGSDLKVAGGNITKLASQILGWKRTYAIKSFIKEWKS